MRRLTVSAFVALALASPAVAQQAKSDLQSFLPAEAPVVISFRPAALLKLKDVKSLYNELTRPDEVKRIVDVAEPESVEEIRFVLLRRPAKLEGDPHEILARDAVVIVRTNKPREWKALAAAAQVPVTKATHGSKEYYRMSGDGPIGFGFVQLDDMSVVIGAESNLKQIIDVNKAVGADEDPRAEAPGPRPIAGAAIDFAWIRGLLAPAIESEQRLALSMSVIRPIWEKTNRVMIQVTATDADGVTVIADHNCADEEGAMAVQKTVEAILMLANNVAPELIKTLRSETGGDANAAEMANLAEQGLKTASVERKGTSVRLKVSAKLDLAKLARIAVTR